jgi:hypothetical protein
VKSTPTPIRSAKRFFKPDTEARIRLPEGRCEGNQGCCPFWAPDQGVGEDRCLRLVIGSVTKKDGWAIRNEDCPFGHGELLIVVRGHGEAEG